jgi:hypothetical protein
MRALLPFLLVLPLTGCSKDDSYKKSLLPLYDSVVKIRNDIHDGRLSPSFSDDCDAALNLLEKARRDLSQDDQSRTSFVNTEGALESYIAVRSITPQAPPDKITAMANGAASDLQKAHTALEKGE